MVNVILSSFLDGFTGGSLFVEARRPGAPTQVFADEESNYPQRELVTSLMPQQNGNALSETQLRDTRDALLEAAQMMHSGEMERAVLLTQASIATLKASWPVSNPAREGHGTS